MAGLRDRYFNTLGFLASDTSKCESALRRAYALRTFEIEHYWKRATYFWGFQIAIFAAFGLLWKADTNANPWGLITVALSGLGVLTAVANSLSASGSKFWQENWEHHIDMLEDNVEGRLHKTVWLRDGRVCFSVSRINRTLGSLIIIFLLVVTLYVAYNYVGSPPIDLDFLYYITAWWQMIVIIAVITFGVGMLLRQTSDLRGTLPESDGKHSQVPINRFSRWSRRITPNPIFIRRYAPDEPADSSDAAVQ